MSRQRSRLEFILRPTPDERAMPMLARARFAMMGVNALERVTPESSPELTTILGEVSNRAGLPAPVAFIWDSKSDAANAVALPAKVPVVAFSRSITTLLNPEELAAVAAHELGHVKNMRHAIRDYWMHVFGGAAVAGIIGAPIQKSLREEIATGQATGVRIAANSVLSSARFMAPLVAGAYAKRKEEKSADQQSAQIVGDGTPLVSALSKLKEFNAPKEKGPVRKLLAPLSWLTRTHPSFVQRQKALGVSDEQLATYQQHPSQPVIPPITEEISVEPTDQRWQQKIQAELAARQTQIPER